jgi:hypothetical protein
MTQSAIESELVRTMNSTVSGMSGTQRAISHA